MPSIDAYRGTRFPEWVGDPSYHNLTKLSLSNCQYCCILPPLGQLHCLKNLTISRMSMLETIGFEFFHNGDSFSETPFPSLEHLEFRYMPCWEVWHHPHGSNASFPVLKSLVICGCPKLLGDLPSHLPALDKIQIEECDQLASSLPRASAIRTLEICESNKLVLRELPLSLEALRIQGREVAESVLEAITNNLPNSLRKLTIRDCSSEISFSGDCLPTSLNSLSITGCRNLDFPKQNHQHESLRSLRLVRSCESLTTLPLETLLNLYDLFIQNCENIECLSVSKIIQNLVSIAIDDCLKFVSFTRDGFPCHVNTLLPQLQVLIISSCPKIETFPEGGIPPSLRTLKILNCEKLLRSPSLTLMGMLHRLIIGGPCDGVEFFPKEGFALLPPSLVFLSLCNLSSLRTLECRGLLLLTSLRELTISDCPELENIAGERLPSSLTRLQIFDCPLLAERCCVKHPQIWPKISHIQTILLDRKRIS